VIQIHAGLGRAGILAFVALFVTSSFAQSDYSVVSRGPDWNLHQKTVIQNGVTNVHKYS
jgi:hypothetical protein